MYGREELDVNKLVYATDIDTMLVDCEGTEVWPQDSDGCEYYFKSQADKVMNAMERRIARLTALVEGWKKNSVVLGEMYHKRLEDVQYSMATENTDLGMENFKLKERVKELESQLPKWISVKDRLPNVGDIVLVCFADRAKSHYFPIDVVRWDSSYELQEISVAHWMPLPPPPTTKEK